MSTEKTAQNGHPVTLQDLIKEKKWQTALHLAKEKMGENPASCSAILNVATVYILAGQPDRAEKYLNLARERASKPVHHETLLNLQAKVDEAAAGKKLAAVPQAEASQEAGSVSLSSAFVKGRDGKPIRWIEDTRAVWTPDPNAARDQGPKTDFSSCTIELVSGSGVWKPGPAQERKAIDFSDCPIELVRD
jgi:hypothetical protein